MAPDLLTEIDNATQAYCAQAQGLALTATDFYDWLEFLPRARRDEVRQRGLRASHAELEFIRYCLEWRGIDLWSFMAANLSLPAFDLWNATGQHAGPWLRPHRPFFKPSSLSA